MKWSTGCLRLDRTAIGAIKQSTGDKMVCGPSWLDKIVFGLDKTAIGGDEIFYGLPWLDKNVYWP